MNEETPTVARSAFPSIPGYRVRSILGTGGMGVVYLATDETLERDVAIKLLSADSSDAGARFLREARSMATVKHPNIVPIYTFGECDDGAFLVMEYCAGGSLSERIEARGSIPVAEAVETVGKIAHALASAWKKGVVHRDVKPSNVLMDEDGGLFVADFGLAKRVDTQGDASITEEGIFVGTPHYIAPEVVSGKKADHRSDIYALGIVLFELLTGERPYQASSAAAVVALQIHGQLPNLREKCAEASEPLVALVESMTAKDPAKRPQSYEDLLQRLESPDVRADARASSESTGKRVFMDRHYLGDATAQDVATAHQHDLAVQSKYGVKAMTYWFDRDTGHTYCLLEAPTKEAVTALHREAHGFLPDKIIEVQPEMVEAFMGRRVDPEGGGDKPLSESGFRTLMVTTVANAAALANELGDEAALDAIGEHESVLTKILGTHEGLRVRSVGDGFLASFASTSQAVECAIAMQRETAAQAGSVHIKIGLNAGEPVAKNNDLFGTTVNLTDAICGQSDADLIVASQVIRDLCRGKKLPFSERGDAELAGFDEPIRLFEVDWREGAA